MAYNGLQFDEVKEIISRYCCFSLGISNVRRLMPLHNELALKRENERLNEAIHLCVSYGTMPFVGIHDVSDSVLLAMKNATLMPEELLKIAQQSTGIEQILAYLKASAFETVQLHELCDSLQSNSDVAARIFKCIAASGEVCDNASPALSSIRKKIVSLNHSISAKMAQYIQKNSEILQEDIVATRNGRCVVLVKNNYKNSVAGLQYGSSASNNSVYIEPECMVSLNNDLQNALDDEKKEIQRILFSLSQLVKENGDSYLANNETLGILDSLFARARYAKEKNGIVAEISKKNFILEKARHPLIEEDKVIANSYHMVDPIRTILISGANTGGKTVSLKIIGLFSLLYLSGIPILCDKAEIPFFDRIYYDIGDNQSIDDDLSTFGSHIRNIANICSKATRNSLVILDELGSSTDPEEGQALACAVLDFLCSRNIYTVATTHFSKLKNFAKEKDNIMVSSVEFDQKTLTPTYRYIENSIGSSNAIEIAKRYQLRDSIVEMAYQLKNQQMSQSDILMEKLQNEYELTRQNNEKLQKMQDELQLKNQDLQKQIDRLNLQKEAILNQAQQQADEIILQTQLEGEELIEEIKSKESLNIKEVASLRHKLNTMSGQQESDDEETINDEEIRIGDYVRIVLTGQCGEVTDLKKKDAVINSNGIKIKSSISGLKKTARPKEKEKAVSVHLSKNASFSTELNIIGLTVYEATAEIDHYLDAAVVNRAPFVRIVHGMGTGALRKALWDMLKKNPNVSNYELAPASQGGSGATIVTFGGKNAEK